LNKDIATSRKQTLQAANAQAQVMRAFNMFNAIAEEKARLAKYTKRGQWWLKMAKREFMRLEVIKTRAWLDERGIK
jgi:hypothetical protein